MKQIFFKHYILKWLVGFLLDSLGDQVIDIYI